MGECSKFVKADAIELNGEVTRDWRGSPKGGAEAVSAIDDGTVGVEEGDECGLDIVESW